MDERIAVIGLGCRFPGAEGAEQLWELLVRGGDATQDVPADRFDLASFFSPEPATPGKTASRRGAFIDRADQFDPGFFDISAHEASKMDPQHRLLLMTAWEALEDAGQPPSRFANSRTGVFVGMMNADYWDLQCRKGTADMDLYAFTGSHQRSLASGRLSYAFDLRGPSMTIDAACASSLVALHTACLSLRAGESSMALACGVNLALTPHENIMYSSVRMMAPDGRCKFGDASANGFVRGEGVGVLVLKPLERALADGDRVRAVLLGSAVSNDGRSKDTLTAPSEVGQQTAMRWAYENAGISPAEVDYVEAHGTGTRIDLVELRALGAVLGPGRPKDRPCLVGSIKTNIGHAEGAAGIAGVIKTVLCLEHGQVPPNLHFHQPHPQLDWEQLPLIIPTEMHPLPSRGRPAIAAVSGQGISSTNVCIVLGQADPSWLSPSKPDSPTRPHLLTASARSGPALADLCRALIAHLEPGGPGRAHSLRDICHTAALRRSHHEVRLAVVGASHDELVERIRNPSESRERKGDSLRIHLEELAALYVSGTLIDWSDACEAGGRLVPLPSYPWQLERYWLDSREGEL